MGSCPPCKGLTNNTGTNGINGANLGRSGLPAKRIPARRLIGRQREKPAFFWLQLCFPSIESPVPELNGLFYRELLHFRNWKQTVSRAAGDTLKIERLAVEAGQSVTFDRVLLVNARAK